MNKTFLLHVKKGYDQRLEHMTKILSTHNIPFELVLDGDIEDLTDEIIDTYFTGNMHSKTAATSCAYKHILSLHKIVNENLDYALVLEDDIFFSKKFDIVFQKSLQERTSDKTPWYVGFEATCLKFVPRSQRLKGTVTYKSNYVQCTGAYLINQSAAQVILDTIKSNKCDIAIDLYLNELQKQGRFSLYWSHPPVVEQGSHNGKMQSLIDGYHSKSIFRVFTRKATVLYKKCLYFFR